MHCAIVRDFQGSKNSRDKSTRKNFAQRGAYCGGNQPAFLWRDNEGRNEEDVIAVDAIDAALGGVGENVFVEGGLADAVGDVVFFGEWLASGFVFYEFDAEEQAEAANFTDVRMRIQGGEFGAKNFCGGFYVIEELLRLDVIENGIAGGGGYGMGLIGEAVLEGAGTAFECIDDAGCDEDGAEGRVTAGDSLPYQDDVWLDIPVLDGEGFSCAAHAAHDFVGDQENAAVAADCGDALGVAVRRYGGAESCANYGLEDESSHSCGVVRAKEIFEIVCAGDRAVRKTLIERTVIAKAGGDVSPFGEHGLIGSAAGDVAADGHGAESAAVVALTARDDAIARRLPAFSRWNCLASLMAVSVASEPPEVK